MAEQNDRNESAPLEKPVVKTTIVGGRPPGSGKENDSVPRGIEILVKKASVDPDFKETLLKERAAAAGQISLSLDNSEVAMLNNIPRSHLEGIISATKVSPNMKQIFLGCTAAVMLAALTSTAGASDDNYKTYTEGIRPDDIPDKPYSVRMGTQGVRPDEVRVGGIRPDEVSTTMGMRIDEPDTKNKNRQPSNEETISKLNIVVTINPNYANYCARGYAYNNNKNFSQAISDYSKAIEMEPENGSTYGYRAETYFNMGEYDKAWKDIHKAESLNVAFAKDNPFIVKLVKASGREK